MVIPRVGSAPPVHRPNENLTKFVKRKDNSWSSRVPRFESDTCRAPLPPLPPLAPLPNPAAASSIVQDSIATRYVALAPDPRHSRVIAFYVMRSKG
jgi:hypothetical protein